MRALILAVLVVTGSLLSLPFPAHAVPVCQYIDPLTGQCTLTVDVPGSAGGGAPAAPAHRTMCTYGGAPISCSQNGGWWSASRGCYLTGLGTSIPTYLGGSTMADAAPGYEWYVCIPVGGSPGGTYGGAMIQLPAGAPPVVVDPEILARQAIETMDLRAIDVGVVPPPGPDSIGLVGLPVWMWVADENPNTWGPLTQTASAGTTSVTAVARVAEIDWNMGDGTVVTCTGPGTPYADAYGDAMSPDCGHRYVRTSVGLPADSFAVTATSQWQIEWSGGGDAGTIPFTLSASVPVRVGELQVLVAGQG